MRIAGHVIGLFLLHLLLFLNLILQSTVVEEALETPDEVGVPPLGVNPLLLGQLINDMAPQCHLRVNLLCIN